MEEDIIYLDIATAKVKDGDGKYTIPFHGLAERTLKEQIAAIKAAGDAGAEELQRLLDEIPEGYPELSRAVDAMKRDKQDKIDDLAAIRQGSNKGNTALQDGDLDELRQLVPDAAPVAGKVLKVLNVNPDGTFTCEWADGGSGGGKVDDVQINGASVLSGKVANIPFASTANVGVVKVAAANGLIASTTTGLLSIQRANDDQLASRNQDYRPIVPSNLDLAVKNAMCDGKGAEWTEAEKGAARQRMGAASDDDVNGLNDDLTQLQNTGDNPATAGKVWTANASGAGWEDPQGGTEIIARYEKILTLNTDEEVHSIVLGSEEEPLNLIDAVIMFSGVTGNAGIIGDIFEKEVGYCIGPLTVAGALKVKITLDDGSSTTVNTASVPLNRYTAIFIERTSARVITDIGGFANNTKNAQICAIPIYNGRKIVQIELTPSVDTTNFKALVSPSHLTLGGLK